MIVTLDNYKLLCAKLYKNHIFTEEEFEKDLSLIKKISKKIERYSETGKINTRLVFNNFIIACNCFGKELVIKCLYLISNQNIHDLIMTFLSATINFEDNVVINKELRIKYDSTKINRAFFNKIVNDLKII